MLQLNSYETLAITRQLEDPTDSTTRYVQAKFYKPATSATAIKTVNLTDNGGQLFTGTYQIPADEGGNGYFLTMVIKVYDDSGYTTESNRYTRKQVDYLVHQRWDWPQMLRGRTEFDYGRMEEIVKKEMGGKIPEKIEDLNKGLKKLEDLEKNLKKVEDRIGKIHIPETDFSSVIKAINNMDKGVRDDIKRKVDGIRIPTTDLSPVLQEINSTPRLREIEDSLEKVKKSLETRLSEVENIISYLKDHIIVPIKTDSFQPKKKKTKKELLKAIYGR